MSKVFIFGSSGFVGNSISECLEANHRKIIRIDRLLFNSIVKNPDILRREVKKEDKFVFASAIVPVKTLSNLVQNLSLVQAFIEICSGLDFSYILNISSDAVYGDYLRPISEKDIPMPTTIHGLMHYAREFVLCQKFRDRLGNLRPTSIFGVGDSHNSYGPNLFVRQALSNKTIRLIGQGEERRDHIYIRDVAEIAYKMLSENITGELNAASGNLWSFEDIAILIQSQVPDSRIEYLPRGFGSLPHNGYRAFDISKLQALFPNLRLTSLERGIQRYLGNGE